MHLVSNAKSIRCGEPSVLALAETLAASSVSFWLAWRFGSLQHIAVSSMAAPLLLLHSHLSISYTFRIIERITAKVELEGRYSTHARWLARLFFLPVLSIIKLFSTVLCFLRRPIETIERIPGNFLKQIACIDLMIPPMFIPGSEYYYASKESYRAYRGDFNVYYLIRTLCQRSIAGETGSVWSIVVTRLVRLMVVLPAVVLALAYRWALKSTAILWLPLIWIVMQARPGIEVISRLKFVKQSTWSRTMRAYSLIVLLAFLAKLAMLAGVWNLTNLEWLGPLGVATTRLVAPVELPLWQVAGGLNALLAWAFFFRADQHLLMKDTAEAWPEPWLRQEYAVFQAVRTTLSLYVIACTFYITAAVAWQTEWPPIRFVLFSWTA